MAEMIELSAVWTRECSMTVQHVDHVLVVTGQRRQALDHFVVGFGVDMHSSSNGTASSSDPVLQVCTCASVPMTAFRMQQHPCLHYSRELCIASKLTL